jgi:hypothetical protein
MRNWTLRSELLKVTNKKSEADALKALHILPNSSVLYRMRCDKSWERGGAETYIFRFWVKVENCLEQGYIIKACVSLDFHQTLDEAIAELLARRNLLASNGVRVPQLLFAGEGIIIEELIPWKLQEYMQRYKAQQHNLLRSMVDYAAVLAKLRFNPIDGFSDLMTNGSDIIPVDFGQDLGFPGVSPSQNIALFERMILELYDWKILTKQELPDKYRQRFLRAVQ